MAVTGLYDPTQLVPGTMPAVPGERRYHPRPRTMTQLVPGTMPAVPDVYGGMNGASQQPGAMINTLATPAATTPPPATTMPAPPAWQPSPITNLTVQGFQDWAGQTFGREATPNELATIAGQIGYDWQSGAPITPETMAAAQQAAVRYAQGLGWQPPPNTTPSAPTGPRLTVEDAPTFEAPELELPELPDVYRGPGEFRPPTAEDMALDPGYQFRLQTQLRALENAASRLGTTRGGAHMQDLMALAGDLASQEYANVYNRAADTFERNRRTGLDEYQSRLDLYDRGAAAGFGRFDAEMRGREAEYAPQYDTWVARNRANELNLDDEWRRYVYATDDQFRRERARAEDERYNREFDWRKLVYGDTRRDRLSDEAWRQLMLEEDRRRYLTNLGL